MDHIISFIYAGGQQGGDMRVEASIYALLLDWIRDGQPNSVTFSASPPNASRDTRSSSVTLAEHSVLGMQADITPRRG